MDGRVLQGKVSCTGHKKTSILFKPLHPKRQKNYTVAPYVARVGKCIK